jgi:hypothetical protein
MKRPTIASRLRSFGSQHPERKAHRQKAAMADAGREHRPAARLRAVLETPTSTSRWAGKDEEDAVSNVARFNTVTREVYVAGPIFNGAGERHEDDVPIGYAVARQMPV